MSSNPFITSKAEAADQLRTLDDLHSWDFPGTALAVIGQPVVHSVSPAMQNAALNALAQTHFLYRDWCYFKFEVAPEQLPEALALFWERGFHGLNLTLPHKVQAVELVSLIAPEARAMGAVNTLTRLSGGGYSGDNSDGFGLQRALQQDLGVHLESADIVLLGAGGAARAAAIQCLLKGCRSLAIGNRSPQRLQELVSLIDPSLAHGRLHPFDLSSPRTVFNKLEKPIVINATSLGLQLTDPSPLDLSSLPEGTCVFDMTYGVDSALARQARELGLAYADGLSMLVWQGVRSLEIWTGGSVPAQPMLSAACHAKGLAQRSL